MLLIHVKKPIPVNFKSNVIMNYLYYASLFAIFLIYIVGYTLIYYNNVIYNATANTPFHFSFLEYTLF